jgi:hypothetical protein
MKGGGQRACKVRTSKSRHTTAILSGRSQYIASWASLAYKRAKTSKWEVEDLLIHTISNSPDAEVLEPPHLRLPELQWQ